MVTEVRPTIDRDIQDRFGVVADDASVKRAAAALEGNGITVLRAADAQVSNAQAGRNAQPNMIGESMLSRPVRGARRQKSF